LRRTRFPGSLRPLCLCSLHHPSLLLHRPPPPATLFPYTTLFRSSPRGVHAAARGRTVCLGQPNDGCRRWGRRRALRCPALEPGGDRKSTRLNSSHVSISYAVFCLKKKKRKTINCELADSDRGTRA